MHVYALALDGVFDLTLSAILDAFQTANEPIEMTGLDVPQFEVEVVGLRTTVRTADGLNVPIQPVEDKRLNALLFRQSHARQPSRFR